MFDGSNSLKAQTSYLYDQYNSTSGLATLLVRSSPIQYQAPSDFRGNITSITKTVSRVTGTGAGAQSDVVVKRAYDSLGNIVKTKDARGCETSISYDTAAFALVTEIKKCAVNAVELALQYENDFNIGKPTLVVAPNKVRTKVEYGDTLDRITKISYGVNALNTTSKAVTIFNYGDTPGSLYVRTSNDQFAANDSKLKSEVQFDNLGRESLLCTGNYCAGTSPTAIQVSKEYNGFGQNRKVSNPGSGNPSADKTTTSYDVLGRPISVCHPDAACDTNEYSLETVLEVVAGKQRKTAIDAFGRLVSVIEAPSDTTMQYFTGYGYDVFNNLISVLQKKKIGDNSSDLTRTFNHDSLGRLLDATNPERSPMFYSYDPNGNVLTVQDSRVIVTNTLDDLNRVVTKSYSDGATPQARYCYDGFYFLNGLCTGSAVESSAGAQTAYGNAISSTRFSHDSFGRVSSSQQTTGGVSPSIDYSYYANDSLASQVLGARTQTTCYDQLGRSLWVSLSLTSTDCKIGTSATSTNTVARATQFADHGAIKELIFANGLRENWCFNNRLQGTGLHLGVTASTDCSFVSGEVFGLGLEFTSGSQSLNNGNVMAQVIRMRPNDASTNQIRLRQTYTYDNVNRIASAVEIAEVGSTGSGWSMNWAYDHRGNMWVSSHNTPLTVGTPEKLTWYDQTRNQLSYISDTQNAGTTNFYDLSGNLTSRPKEVGAGVDTFTYDGENRINTVNGAATYYQYDPVGKRVVTQTASPSRTVTFIYNAFGQLVREYGSSIQNSGYSYLTQDNLGSTRVITSPTGNVLARMDYEPFGRELTSGSATARRTPLPDGTFTSITGFGGLSAFKQRFTGKERDSETGLDYFGARYFSGAQGRFTSPDWSATPQPVPYADFNNPQSLNLYSYVRNNPLSRTDPDGHETQFTLTPEQTMEAGYVIGNLSGGVAIFAVNAGIGITNRVRQGLNLLGGNYSEIPRIELENSLQAIGSDLAMAVLVPGGRKGGLPNEAVVVRGGLNKAENFANGSGVTINASGNLQGVSVNSAAGKSVTELSQGIMNNKVGVTTVGQVRAAGGNVNPDPTPNNPNHCTMCGVTPQKASELMRVIPNPAKKPEQQP